MTLHYPDLRDYQVDVSARGRNRMAHGRRGIIQGETGSGKSILIGYLAECAYKKGNRVLILADRRRLVKQLGSVLDAFRVPYGVIMSGETGATRERVILASRDTFVAWVKSREQIPFDLILIDECHKALAATYQAILAHYPKAYVIGFTATPARDDGRSMGDFFQWLECTVPASRLIADGWLIKPEVFAPVELASKRKKGEGRGLTGDPVSHWRRHADGLPTIAFAAKTSESQGLRDIFLAAGIPAEHIDASVSDELRPDGRTERDDYYDRLANGTTKVLCSVGLLVEGVDIPEVSAAIIWSKFGSVVKWRQACGRTMRPCPRINKTRSVILDHAGAAGAHGLPGEDVEWSLDLASTVGERRKKAADDGRIAKTVICKSCGFSFAELPACPNCGKAIPRAERKRTAAQEYEAAQDEILTRFSGEEARDMLHEQRQRHWHRSIYTAIAKGGTAGMAAAMFKTSCKINPWEAGVDPLPRSWKGPARDEFPTFVRERTHA